jgi:hypothetical protein
MGLAEEDQAQTQVGSFFLLLFFSIFYFVFVLNIQIQILLRISNIE